MVKSSTPADSGKPSRSASQAEWAPVFHMVKEGLWALKWMPVMALALAVLAVVFNHHNRDANVPATAACQSCETNQAQAD